MLISQARVIPDAITEATFSPSALPEEAFMSLLLLMSDSRKRVMILSLLSFLALC